LVVTIHDVKPLLFASPGSGLPRRRWLERLLIPDPWKRIDHVITDSFCSRQDILSRLPVAVEKVSVVYPGINLERFRPLHESSRTSTLEPRTSNAPHRPYVLCVAGADPTKNVPTLIKAFAALSAPVRDAHDLVLVGDFRRRTEVAALVAESGIDKQTIFPGIVTDEELIQCYQHARLCVCPSLYEGFGYPVVEAMACGCPVISSNTSSLPEVAGDAAVLVSPADVNQLSRQLERLLNDPDQRTDLRHRGLKQASRFSWERAVKDMIAVYEKVGLGGKGVQG
jgi:glycosyltransferase involved in cell wall biosynthesis